jgi:hypothetical protein
MSPFRECSRIARALHCYDRPRELSFAAPGRQTFPGQPMAFLIVACRREPLNRPRLWEAERGGL